MAAGGQLITAWIVFIVTTALARAENSTAEEQGWFTIVGSKSFRSNSEYECTVTLSPADSSQPTKVTVEIEGDLNSGTKFSASQTAEVKPSVTTSIKLQIGDAGPGKYTLKARGEGGLEFSNSTELELQSKGASVFIQTDKAIYKPGAKVQFRVLALDPNLKPITSGSTNVHITDGDGNRVKEWREVITKKGVWSGELQLSEFPVLGDWTIQVLLLDQKVTKNFEVAEYVLPKFEVFLNSPQHALLRDAKVPVSISAKYTYGGPVKGEATVTAKLPYSSKGVSKVVPIDGEAVVDFSLVDELDLKHSYVRSVNFEATVEESLTGKKQNATGSISLHNNEYKIELVKKSRFFKPGLDHVAYLKVLRYDGTPVTDSSKPVIVASRFSYDTELDIAKGTSYEIPKSGLVKLTFHPPKNASILDLKASYENTTNWLQSFGKAESRSNNFIDVNIISQNPQVSSDIEVEVNMTEHSPSIIYQVQGRGGVISAGDASVEEGKTTASFKFPATPEMAPKAKLVVYYIREDLEIIADSVKIDIDYSLPNFVNLKSNVTESEPGRGIELKVESKPNSYVGLLGIDQSVLILKKGNDISKNEVMDELEAYSPALNTRSFFGWNVWTAEDVFRDASAFVLTNGHIHIHELPKPVYFMSAPAPSGAFGAAANFAPLSAIADSASVMSPAIPLSVKPRLRSNFPETWIWQGVDTNNEGSASLNETVPDTITSWVISAFSVDSEHGLGLIDQPAKIKVFRPFFLSLDLPYSIIRGETVTIPVILFNYMDTEVTADVTLLNLAGQFEFGDDTNSLSDKSEKVQFKKEKVTVKPNSGERTSFTITATELGHIGIKVTAKSDIAGDAVERKLLVKAEGETQYMNQAVFVDLRKVNSFEESVTVDIPDDCVPGSAHVEVSAIGDILGTSLQNLERLIRMPFGCGEQNMLNFVPNIIVLDYLKNSGQLTPPIESKCLNYMDLGYQRELTYKHNDGSFSAFGNSDRSGSTWLTAFVLKSFASAEPYMKIDGDVIQMGLAWLAQRQTPNGTFPEVGTVSHKDMQGGSGQGLALTSYSLLPFLAYNKSEHTDTVAKALEYIANQLNNIKNDSYSLAISTYVLHLAQHPAKDSAFELLQSSAHTTGSMKRWKRAEKKSDTENPHAIKPNSVDVEMTAYAMLTYLERGLVEDSMPIMNWLMTQQNSDGGFASTQDTVVALSALSKLAEKIADKNADVTVSFSTNDGFTKDLSINSDNSLVLQKLEIPGNVKKVDIKAKGHGLAVVQVSYSYNVDVTGAWPMFNIQPQVRNSSDPNQLLLDICSSFVSGADGDDESSNMVVMEVMLPSGYSVDQDSVQDLQSTQSVKRVELKEADTHVVLYFDRMTKEELCPSIIAVKTHKVEKPKPVPITVYDYYDQSRRARVFYAPPDA